MGEKTPKTYVISVNGEKIAQTNKTHYTIENLLPEQTYVVAVSSVGKITVKTKAEKQIIDVTKLPYNACGDGKTLNTQAIQSALNDCNENTCVYFPAGVYLTGALDIHSNTEIYLEEGATLQGSKNYQHYLPKIKSRFEGTETMCYRSLLNMGQLDHDNYGFSCKNVVIRGKGNIFGGGKALAEGIIEYENILLKDYLTQNADYVKTCECANTIAGRARGRLINMNNCDTIILSGLTMGYGPAWNIHFVYSKNIITFGCSILSDTTRDEDGNIVHEHVWNGDGWDPDSSEDCVVFDTTFRTGDDCIAIKSGKNPELIWRLKAMGNYIRLK